MGVRDIWSKGALAEELDALSLDMAGVAGDIEVVNNTVNKIYNDKCAVTGIVTSADVIATKSITGSGSNTVSGTLCSFPKIMFGKAKTNETYTGVYIPILIRITNYVSNSTSIVQSVTMSCRCYMYMNNVLVLNKVGQSMTSAPASTTNYVINTDVTLFLPANVFMTDVRFDIIAYSDSSNIKISQIDATVNSSSAIPFTF